MYTFGLKLNFTNNKSPAKQILNIRIVQEIMFESKLLKHAMNKKWEQLFVGIYFVKLYHFYTFSGLIIQILLL